MSGHERDSHARDPFGRSIGERVWRRLAGAGLVVTLAAVGFTLWTTEVLPWVLVGALVIYILGVPASWAVTRHGGAPVRRHMVAAVGLGALVSAVLSLLAGDLLGWPVFAMFSVGLGVPLAALAAWSGLALPRRWVRPVAVIGLLIAGIALPLGTWLERRPPSPHDFVIIHEPDAARQHFDDAYALAHVIAEMIEDKADDQNARTAHPTWVAVGQDISEQELDNIPSRIRYTLDEDLPTLRASGEPVRLVTTIFADEPARGCVVVTAAASRAEPHACADLDLAD